MAEIVLYPIAPAFSTFNRRLGDRAHDFSDLRFRKKVEYTWLPSLMRRYKDLWQITLDAEIASLKALPCWLRGT